ncbi:MAG: hypothetical protein ACLFVO_28850 [Chloroflexaceae bacterium]
MSSRDMPTRRCWSRPHPPPGITQPHPAPPPLGDGSAPAGKGHHGPEGERCTDAIPPQEGYPAIEAVGRFPKARHHSDDIQPDLERIKRLRPFQVAARDPVPPNKLAGGIAPEPANTPPTRIGPVDRVILRVSVTVQRLQTGGPAGEAIPPPNLTRALPVQGQPHADGASVLHLGPPLGMLRY